MGRLLKVQKNLINEFIDDERQKKRYQNVEMEIERIKKEGVDSTREVVYYLQLPDSTAFWELLGRE